MVLEDVMLDHDLLRLSVAEHRRAGRSEAWLEAWLEGWVGGSMDATRRALWTLLEQRFGELHAADQMRLAAADPKRLESALARVTSASDIREVFEAF
jgi:hypothetical protein